MEEEKWEKALTAHTDQLIEEVLEGKPRASDLSQMISALEERRKNYAREAEQASDDRRRKELHLKIREAESQIRVLREEQAITEFVEDSVRASVNRPSGEGDLPESL